LNLPAFRPLELLLIAAAAALGAAFWRSEKRLRRALGSLQELQNVAHGFAEAFDPPDIAARAFEAAAAIGPLRRFELYFFDDADRVREVWAWDLGPPEFPFGRRDDHPRLHAAFSRENLDRLTRTETAHSFSPLDLQVPRPGQRRFHLPLFAGSRTVGYWELDFGADPGRGGLDRLASVYRYLTDSLYAERNFRLAARDGLSNLFVRRFFDGRLGSEVIRAERYGRPLSVAAFDLDHFKDLNDAHGHAAGDQAIRVFSEILRGSLREQDLCSRRGGEEFAAYFPETSPELAARVCERIRERLSSSQIEFEGKKIALTVSVGVAGWTAGDDLDRLLTRADQALYEAKSLGRDRVIVI
jgi:diguanylate cyclase (GGDEF)-like protein